MVVGSQDDANDRDEFGQEAGHHSLSRRQAELVGLVGGVGCLC